VIIVVGGGVAGLVAARRLALGGQSVLLLEAADRLGGAVAEHVVGGVMLDAAAESFSTRGGAVVQLATSLGLADDIVESRLEGAWLRRADGSTVPVPATSLLGIPGVPLASDVMAVVGKRAAFRALLDELMPGTVGARAVTVGELVRKRMGRGLLDALVTPVAQGIHSRHPDELELDRVAPALRQALLREGSLARAVRDLRTGATARSSIQGIRGGVRRLVIELTADLERFGVEMRLGARVTGVEAGAVMIGDERIEGDVLVAAPHLLGATDPDEVLHMVTLVVESTELDAPPRGTGVLIADGGARATAITHSTAKWPWLAERVGMGRHVIRLSYASPVTGAQAVADAEDLLGVRIGHVIDSAMAEWRRPARQGAAPDGIWATGEATSGSGLAAVVSHATLTADALLEQLAHL
jgi:protoporphyrinogen/coproporphyrinogen III oxidase